jgi:hypothetical protein
MFSLLAGATTAAIVVLIVLPMKWKVLLRKEAKKKNDRIGRIIRLYETIFGYCGYCISCTSKREYERKVQKSITICRGATFEYMDGFLQTTNAIISALQFHQSAFKEVFHL